MYFLRESEFVVKDRNIKQIKDLRCFKKWLEISTRSERKGY